MSLKKKKNIILVILIVICTISSIGYVMAFRDLKIMGKLRLSGAKWEIRFTDITTSKKIGSANNFERPKLGNYVINFYAEFVNPGDQIEYKIKIANKGNLDAVVTNIHFLEDNNKFIDYVIDGIDIGTVLKKDKEMEIGVKLLYSKEDTYTQNGEYKNIVFMINWEQYKK